MRQFPAASQYLKIQGPHPGVSRRVGNVTRNVTSGLPGLDVEHADPASARRMVLARDDARLDASWHLDVW